MAPKNRSAPVKAAGDRPRKDPRASSRKIVTAVGEGLNASDLFCGAGGSSLGLRAAGVRIAVGVNHWPLAVATHQLNFPDTDHEVADISQVDPRRYQATDLLWASPECVNHSMARGVARAKQADTVPLAGIVAEGDAAQRSRATMWDVPRFAEAMAGRGSPYSAVIVENVVDAIHWGPGGNGALFGAWLHTMGVLGYEHQLLFLNSAFARTESHWAPQYRDRLYIVFHRRGAVRPELEWPVTATCGTCGEVTARKRWKRPERPRGRYRTQYQYHCEICSAVVAPHTRSAASAIDWTDPGRPISERARPLAEATMRRIDAGLARHRRGVIVHDKVVTRRGRLGPRQRSDGVHLPRGFMMRNNGAHGRAGGEHCTGLGEPFRTLTTAGHQSLVLAPSRRSRAQDCWFRMLRPHEVGAAMGFPEDYKVLGNDGERLKQYGNAVTPGAAQLICQAVATALAA